jgi:nickel transport protein
MTGGRFIQAAVFVLSLGVATIGPWAVDAHRLNLFAVYDGVQVVGDAYFTGGAGARGLNVGAVDATGKQVATARTDDAGHFIFPSLPPKDVELIVDSGDGHVAGFRLSAAELGGAPAPAGSLPQERASETATLPAEGFEQIVERVVARRLAPLRRQIAAYEAKVRLHDIIGGLGYLAGLAGLGFWWLARRERRGRKP